MEKALLTELCNNFNRLGGMIPAVLCPELNELLEELFTEEEAEIAAKIPPVAISAPDLAKKLSRPVAEITPLLESRIMPQTERFISHYQIVDQDVSDLAYTVHLSVTVDTDLLRKNLARIGVIKEPGSLALAAVFVTVDAPLGLDHVKSLGGV
ncbi:MAG: hypothetical protein JRH12_06810, partial [Deltaproteobacteria bacterium]|nr:hypothetical protein [Deltaproteobacteria bacterium]